MSDGTAFKIERDVPVPPHHLAGEPGVTVAGTVRALKVGESVLFPAKSRYAAIAAIGRVLPAKCIGRQVEGGFRVWRVS